MFEFFESLPSLLCAMKKGTARELTQKKKSWNYSFNKTQRELELVSRWVRESRSARCRSGEQSINFETLSALVLELETYKKKSWIPPSFQLSFRPSPLESRGQSARFLLPEPPRSYSPTEWNELLINFSDLTHFSFMAAANDEIVDFTCAKSQMTNLSFDSSRAKEKMLRNLENSSTCELITKHIADSLSQGGVHACFLVDRHFRPGTNFTCRLSCRQNTHYTHSLFVGWAKTD